ncbi:MAG: LytTR family DNA-binding domain-containing protein [Bacteroidota bacterium]|nr:LytTR family DNA-binding domain-containing protein [Bacteroidota bacterium]
MGIIQKCVIVDDEPKAISVLSSLISGISELNLLASFSDPCEALSQIEDLNPDLLFVDIEMPQKNGFELVDSIRLMGLDPKIIFTTGYDQFAVKAIKQQAYDYLLKPVTRSEILEVLSRSKHDNNKNGEKSKVRSGRLRFNTLNGFFVVEIEQVVYIKADGNYSEMHMRNGSRKLITSNLARIEALLDSKVFCRIGRSLIVNTDYLTQVNRRKGLCILKTGDTDVALPISRKWIRKLGEMFE